MLYVGLMFIFAKSPQSSALNMSQGLLKWFPFLAQSNLSLIIVYIRKTIHVIGYFIGTILIFNAVRATPVFKRMPYLATGLLGLLVAIFDEWYQTALPHRSGQIQDVLIDLVGILIALTLVKIKLPGNKQASGSS